MTNKEKREAAGLSVRALAYEMQPRFPRMSATVISLAERPAESGVTYIREAVSVLDMITGFVRLRKPDRRRCPVRIQARLTKADAAEFNSARRAMGHTTINDALVYAIRWYIAQGKKRAAVDAGTYHDGKKNYTNAII